MWPKVYICMRIFKWIFLENKKDFLRQIQGTYNDNLEEGGGDFIFFCDDLKEDNNAPVINILELFKLRVFINAGKNCDNSPDCRK